MPPVTEPARPPADAVMGQPDATGRFGRFGGRFVPESLMPALIELDAAFRDAWADHGFRSELDDHLLRSTCPAGVCTPIAVGAGATAAGSR